MHVTQRPGPHRRLCDALALCFGSRSAWRSTASARARSQPPNRCRPVGPELQRSGLDLLGPHAPATSPSLHHSCSCPLFSLAPALACAFQLPHSAPGGPLAATAQAPAALQVCPNELTQGLPPAGVMPRQPMSGSLLLSVGASDPPSQRFGRAVGGHRQPPALANTNHLLQRASPAAARKFLLWRKLSLGLVGPRLSGHWTCTVLAVGLGIPGSLRRSIRYPGTC